MRQFLKVIFLIMAIYSVANSQNTKSYFEMGEHARENQQFKEAIKYFNFAIQREDGNRPKAITNLCFCYWRIGDYSNAVKYGLKSLDFPLLDSELGPIYQYIGESYIKLNMLDKAFTYFDKGKKIDEIFGIPKEYRFLRDGWEYITTNGYDDIYYKKKSIVKLSAGKFKAWIKLYWNGLSMSNEDLEEVKSLGSISNALEIVRNRIYVKRGNTQFSLNLWEFDLINKKIRTASINKYDNLGNLIKYYSYENESDYVSNNDWDSIVPGTVGEEVFNFVNNQIKIKKEK